MKPLLLFLAILLAGTTSAQKIPLINSGEVLKRATELEGSEKYDLAIKELLTIPPRDTNYVVMQKHLAQLYVVTKEYDKAEAVANNFLKTPNDFRAGMIAIKARAYEKRQDIAGALQILNAGVKEYPFHIDILYQIATTYHNSYDYKNAVKAYYDVIAIYPFSKEAHLNLANIAVLMGEKTHAMMSFGMYLSLASTENARLVALENVASNQLEGEGKHADDRPTGNAYERLDQIIRSKLAMDKKFKTEVPIDAATVKQFEMLFQQLNTASTSTTDDPWMKFYGPIYSSIRDQKMMEPFLYHILESSPIPEVKKWTSKNEKKLEAFYQAMNKLLLADRSTINVPASFGFGPTVHAEYSENHVYGIGVMTNGENEGKWFYFHPDGERSAYGSYKAGKKTGVWNYFSEKGVQTSSENEDTGEITIFEKGVKSVHYFLKGEQTDGVVEFYHPCGSLSETQTQQMGKRTGKSKSFYENGDLKAEFEYADDKLINTWTDYDAVGRVTAKTKYKDGKIDGITESFWPNGKIRLRQTYSTGQESGPSEGFYDNGKPRYKGQYINDNATGEWLYYERSGKQSERRVYKDNVYDKENIFYDDGIPYSKFIYDNGKLVQVVYLDKAGKEVAKYGSPDGTFKAKLLYPGGQLESEGQFKNGKRDGAWKSYHIDGSLDAEYNYVDGEFHGTQTDYYRNGKKDVVGEFENGQLNGYRQEYYVTGQLSREGWLANGERQQQWIRYHEDGTKADDYYFLNDNERDTAFMWSVDGSVSDKSFYTDGVLHSETIFNPVLTDYSINLEMNGEKVVNYPNGSPFLKYSGVCGQATKLERFYPDGKTFSKTMYAANKSHGVYEQYDELGNLATKGINDLGQRNGIWTFNNELGKPDQVMRYVDGKLDSILTAYYDFGGIYFTAAYSDGKRHGVTRILAPNGTPVMEKRYYHGDISEIRLTGKNGQFGAWTPFLPKMTNVAYYDTGTKAYEEEYSAGTLSGARRIYFPDGKLAVEYHYVDGENEGPVVVYYSNGKMCMKGQYRRDDLDGVFEIFQENGMPLKTVTYKMGSKIGTTTVFTKGVKSKEIEYHVYPVK